MLEVNDWKSKPQHFGWIAAALRSPSDQRPRQNVRVCKLGKGDLLGAGMEGSWRTRESRLACASLFRTVFSSYGLADSLTCILSPRETGAIEHPGGAPVHLLLALAP